MQFSFTTENITRNKSNDLLDVVALTLIHDKAETQGIKPLRSAIQLPNNIQQVAQDCILFCDRNLDKMQIKVQSLLLRNIFKC